MDARVIATAAVVGNVAGRFQEAAPAARADSPVFDGLTEVERARLVAGLANARGALIDCEKLHGVMSTPGNKIATLLQSMVVANATDIQPISTLQTLEAKFDTKDWLGWLGTFWQMLKQTDKFTWKAPDAEPQHVKEFDKTGARFAVFGDWGTGLYGAPHIQKDIETAAEPVDMILHLGDVYYSGKKDEFDGRFTNFWPKRAGALNRALNGNHEMYCGGQPYIDTITAAPFGQTSSCFAYQNDHWIVVGLDTAYADHDLANGQAEWLSRMVAKADGRRVVLFSHHQPFSFLSGQGPKLIKKLLPLLQSRAIFAWYWGHEHQCVIYEKHAGWNMYGRCIGHAGMPEFRPAAMGNAVSTRQFRNFPATALAPASLILDGPNPFIVGEERKFTPHGYVTLQFETDRILESVIDADGTVLIDSKELT